jgi:hypothetical protein
VPVLDLDVRIGRPGQDRGAAARLVLAHTSTRRVALPVDDVVGVIEVDAVGAPARANGAPRPSASAAVAGGPAMAAAAAQAGAGPEPRPLAVPDVPVIAPRAAAAPVLDRAPARETREPIAQPDPEPAPDRPGAGTAAGPALADLAAAWAIASTGPEPAAATSIPAATATASTGGIRGDGTQTLVFRRPLPAPTRAVLRVIARDGTERTVEVDGTPLTLGRASDNALVITDPRISRHHARLQARRGTLVFTDLGSTNGSRVNGVRVDECALGSGDRVLVGDTVLLVEQLPG